MSLFLEKFNQYTQNKFSFLKLKGADVFVRKNSIVVNFLYPDGMDGEVLPFKDDICSGVTRVLSTAARVDVKLTMSHFDARFFERDFVSFLKRFPFLTAVMADGDISIFDNGNGERGVKLRLKSYLMTSFKEKNVAAQIKEFFQENYCDPIELIVEEEESSESLSIPVIEENTPTVVLDDAVLGRYIIPQNVDTLIGLPIYDKATYIEDATSPNARLVVCGTLIRFTEHTSRPKEGATEGKKYYRMTIEDFTGKIDFLFFPNKFSADKITLLKVGKQIATRGVLEYDNRNTSVLVYKVKDISYCTLPKNFKLNRLRRAVEKDYLCVKPQEYTAFSQVSIFEQAMQCAPPYLLNKSYVVFDVETTGLSPSMDRIIELGAVKIVDGVMKEVFSTFVDPQVPIPQGISDLTGITDADVRGMPLIGDVIVDFYKFTQDCVLVAQNFAFDHGFISVAGKPLNIHFDNESIDTIPFVRKQFPNIKNYKLGTMADYLGVSLENAHRAIHDAIATAEIFIKTAEKMQ